MAPANWMLQCNHTLEINDRRFENSIQIARSDIVPCNDGLLPVNNLVDAIVGMVRCFRDLEGNDRSVRTSSTVKGISQEK